MLDVEDFYENAWTIAAIVKDGVCLAREYIDGRIERDRKKLLALLERTSHRGPPRNDQQFKKVQGEIMEFKSRQARLLCFFDGSHRIVLANACTKKKMKLDKQEIERALSLRAEYFESKQQK